nr:uncharacterized protein LOC109193963 [Ipomoea trifida]
MRSFFPKRRNPRFITPLFSPHAKSPHSLLPIPSRFSIFSDHPFFSPTMASLKVHSGAATFVHGNRAFVRPKSNPVRLNPNQISQKNQIHRVFAAYSSPPCDRPLVRRDPAPIAVPDGGEDVGGDKIAAEKLDRWMRGSVAEIVKNLTRAPLLVQVYSDGGEEENADVRAERAVVEEWPAVKGEWESGERRSPDGLIFVEELRDDGVNDDEEESFNGVNSEEGNETVTRAWGIVVQGRGAECGPVCYLLKTSKVGAGIGMGAFCTHFCLVRVKSFRESAFCQFKNCWLLQ